MIIGFFAGLFAGALGVGGGSITIPFLLFVIGLPVTKAVATNLLIVTISSLFSLYFHAKQGTLRPKGVVVGILGSIGTTIGNAIFFQLSDKEIEEILGLMFLVLAFLVIVNKEGVRKPSLKELAFVGILMGIYSGVTGKGGGSLAVPLLVLLFKVRTKEAIGVTAAATPLVAFSSLIPKALAGLVCYEVALQFVPGLLLGTMLGARLMKRSRPRTLRLIFSVFLTIVGLKMLS